MGVCMSVRYGCVVDTVTLSPMGKCEGPLSVLMVMQAYRLSSIQLHHSHIPHS